MLLLVGMGGLEPPIFALSERCTNRLCYIPTIVPVPKLLCVTDHREAGYISYISNIHVVCYSLAMMGFFSSQTGYRFTNLGVTLPPSFRTL